jgi:hypothetical protein
MDTRRLFEYFFGFFRFMSLLGYGRMNSTALKTISLLTYVNAHSMLIFPTNETTVANAQNVNKQMST